MVVTEFGVISSSWVRNATMLSFTINLPSAITAVGALLRLADANGSTLVLNGLPTTTTSDGRYAVVTLNASGTYAGTIGMLAYPPNRPLLAA